MTKNIKEFIICLSMIFSSSITAQKSVCFELLDEFSSSLLKMQESKLEVIRLQGNLLGKIEYDNLSNFIRVSEFHDKIGEKLHTLLYVGQNISCDHHVIKRMILIDFEEYNKDKDKYLPIQTNVANLIIMDYNSPSSNLKGKDMDVLVEYTNALAEFREELLKIKNCFYRY